MAKMMGQFGVELTDKETDDDDDADAIISDVGIVGGDDTKLRKVDRHGGSRQRRGTRRRAEACGVWGACGRGRVRRVWRADRVGPQ